MAFATAALTNPAPTQASPRASGDQLWATTYDNGGKNDAAYAEVASPDSSKVFVTGSSVTDVHSSDYDYLTVAYDVATGAVEWAETFDTGGGRDDQAYAIAVSPDGTKVYVTGTTGELTATGDYLTVAYDSATGSVLWEAQYNGPGNSNDRAIGIGVSIDSATVFVTGTSDGGSSLDDYGTVAYDADTGSERWVARYTSPCACDDEASALLVSPDGRSVFVTGEAYGVHPYDFYTLAYDTATGQTLWAARVNVKNKYEDPGYLAITPDASQLFVVGWSGDGVSTDDDWLTVAYEAATGVEKWRERLHGADSSIDDPEGAAVSADGSRLYVTGRVQTGIFTSYMATVAYDVTSGAVLWRIRRAGEGCCIAVAPRGPALYIDETGRGGANSIGAIDGRTGRLRWVASGIVGRLALTPDGSTLLVASSTTGPAGDEDYMETAFVA